MQLAFGTIVTVALLLGCSCASADEQPSRKTPSAQINQPAPPPPPAAPSDRSDQEWYATRKPTAPGDPGAFLAEVERASEGLASASTEDRPLIVRRAQDDGREESRRVLQRAIGCSCANAKTFVGATPVKVSVEIDLATQKARQVTLAWSNGETTTRGPVSDCFRRELADETFPAGNRHSVVSYGLLHMTCGGSSDGL